MISFNAYPGECALNRTQHGLVVIRSPPLTPPSFFIGWYDHAGNVSYVAGYWASQIAWVTAHHPAMPFTVSETGGGGIYEWVNASAPPPGLYWSQVRAQAA